MDELTMRTLESYNWPGNIRELKNLLERIVIMSDAEFIAYDEVISYLPGAQSLEGDWPVEPDSNFAESLRQRIERFEARLLRKEFIIAKGNVSQMASNLKTDRPNLHRKLKKYKIK